MTVGWSLGIANSIVDCIVNGTAFSIPANCFARLYINNGGAVEPGLDTIGAAVEASYTGYVPPNLRTRMAAAGSRQSVSNAVLDFGTPTAGPLDTMQWIGFWTAGTGGTYLGHGNLTTPIAPQIGASFTIAAGNLILRQT